MERLRIGFIGCGRISDLHVRPYRDMKGVEIHSVCDIDGSLAEEKKIEWGARRSFTDYREMLGDPDLDAVEILSPQGVHEEMAVAAAEAGKQIALQKPMTIDVPSADRIIEAVARTGAAFRVTDNYLFYPPVVFAKRLIEDGIIGEPTNLRIKMISSDTGGWPVPPSAWQWRKAEALRGRGMQTFDHGHHLWAVAWYLLGDSEKVISWIDSVDGIIDSPAVIMWKYKKDVCYGMCEYVHAPGAVIPSDYYANDEWFEISGTGGIILINRCTGLLRKGPVVSVYAKDTWTHYEDIPSDWSEGFRGAAGNFVSMLRGKTRPLLSAEEARNILKFALAVGESAARGREIVLDRFTPVSAPPPAGPGR